MLSYIYFNSINSYEDLDLAIVNIPNLPSINENIETIEVDGRNGALTIKNGTYPDRKIKIEFTLKNKKNKHLDTWSKINRVIEWLSDINDDLLFFSFRKDRCFKVKSVAIGDLIRKYNHFGNFEVEFTCEPFMYISYESFITLYKSNNIYYQGNVNGECNIKIYGSGNIQLTVNDETVQINNVDEYVELDSKLLLCLNKDKTSKTRDMIGHFPLLIKGSNNISWEGNVSKVDILPRTAYR